MLKPRQIKLEAITNIDDGGEQISAKNNNGEQVTELTAKQKENQSLDDFATDFFANNSLPATTASDQQLPVDNSIKPVINKHENALLKNEACASFLCKTCGSESQSEDPLFDDEWAHITKPSGEDEWLCKTCKPLPLPAARVVGDNNDNPINKTTGGAVSFHAKREGKGVALPKNPLLLAIQITQHIGCGLDNTFRKEQFDTIRRLNPKLLPEISGEYIAAYNKTVGKMAKHQRGRAVTVANKLLLRTVASIQ